MPSQARSPGCSSHLLSPGWPSPGETHPQTHLGAWRSGVSREERVTETCAWGPSAVPTRSVYLQGSLKGHNSVEDARAAMELYQLSRRIRAR